MSMCSVSFMRFYRYASFFFNDTATPEIYTLSLHDALPISHTSPVASAQVKSAVLLAGLYADGPVSVHEPAPSRDRKSTRLNSSHTVISYAVFCLKKKNHRHQCNRPQRQQQIQARGWSVGSS